MMQTCIDIFKHKYNEDNKTTITDNYTFTPGLYIVVNLQKNEILETRQYNKKEEPIIDSFYYNLAFLDYNSRLVTMNKAIDSTKTIHSNNYLSFFVKNEGKLTKEKIDNYYDILSHPEKKYASKKEQRNLYATFLENYGEPNIQKIEQCKTWIKEHIFTLLDQNKEILKKDYLRIFFIGDDNWENTKKEFEIEGNRYVFPNVFNDTKYNVVSENIVYGMPGANLGLNAKKPFLANKTRKNEIPYLLPIEETLMQKMFFDYLETLCNKGENIVYINLDAKTMTGYKWLGDLPVNETFSGLFLFFKKGKEIEILDADVVTRNSFQLSPEMKINDYLQLDFEHAKQETIERYPIFGLFEKKISSKIELAKMIDQVFFSSAIYRNRLSTDDEIKMTSMDKKNFTTFRKSYFDWLYKGETKRFSKMIRTTLYKQVVHSFGSIKGNYFFDFQQMLILRELLMAYYPEERGGKTMDEKIKELQKIREKVENIIHYDEGELSTDAEFYYAVGQLTAYLLGLSKAQFVTLEPAVQIMKQKEIKGIRKIIERLTKKYAHAIKFSTYSEKLKRQIPQSTYYNHLNKACMSYELQEKNTENSQYLMIGYTDKNLMYKKRVKKEGEE